MVVAVAAAGFMTFPIALWLEFRIPYSKQMNRLKKVIVICQKRLSTYNCRKSSFRTNDMLHGRLKWTLILGGFSCHDLKLVRTGTIPTYVYKRVHMYPMLSVLHSLSYFFASSAISIMLKEQTVRVYLAGRPVDQSLTIVGPSACTRLLYSTHVPVELSLSLGKTVCLF